MGDLTALWCWGFEPGVLALGRVMVTFLLALWWDIGSKYIQLEQVFPFLGVCAASMCNAVVDSGASYVM